LGAQGASPLGDVSNAREKCVVGSGSKSGKWGPAKLGLLVSMRMGMSGKAGGKTSQTLGGGEVPTEMRDSLMVTFCNKTGCLKEPLDRGHRG